MHSEFQSEALVEHRARGRRAAVSSLVWLNPQYLGRGVQSFLAEEPRQEVSDLEIVQVREGEVGVAVQAGSEQVKNRCIASVTINCVYELLYPHQRDAP